MKLLVFFAVVGVCTAEKFSGYGRDIPQIRFELPTEVQVTRENVVFAGQSATRVDEVTGRAHKQYLPPTAQAPVPTPAEEDEQPDIFRVQGLPRAEAGRQFSEDEPSPRNFEQKSQQITTVSSVKFNGQQASENGDKLNGQQQRGFNRQFNSQKFSGNNLQISGQQQSGFSRQFNGLQPSGVNRQFDGQQPSVDNRKFNEPPRQYGPPSDVQADTLITEADPNVQLQDEEVSEDEYDEIPAAKNEGPNIAIANSQVNQGQYFIVTPDNTLRHVEFRTSQSSDNDEFTAHLRYRPVNIYDYRNTPKATVQSAEETYIDRN